MFLVLFVVVMMVVASLSLQSENASKKTFWSSRTVFT